MRFEHSIRTGGDLAQMWRGSALFLPHMAGCSCTGPHLALDRDSIEADLIAYLAQTYRDAGRMPLARFVAVREHETSQRTAFATWLTAIDTASLDEPDRRRLIADLKVALSSIEAASAGGFACE